MQVTDLRGEELRREANAHTRFLEGIIEDRTQHRTRAKIMQLAENAYSLVEITGAGYIAGYIASGGDINTATQFAEYAAVLWAGFKIGVQFPLSTLLKKNHKTIEEKIQQEASEANQLARKGMFHKYKPEYGLDFTNSGSNYNRLIGNLIQSSYWSSLETARKPIRRTIKNMVEAGILYWLLSIVVDVETNIIDFIGLNPVEKGLEIAHYVLGNIEPLKNYVSLEAHQHIGDFNQLHVAYIGLAHGILASARQYAIGNYRRAKAKLSKKMIS